jgi:gliding motility-associated-like protein
MGGQFKNVKVKGGKASVKALAGTYNIMAIEANGCTSTENWNLTVSQPDQITISGTITEIDLKSQTLGAIDISISGGTGSYNILWKADPAMQFAGSTSEDISNLRNGDYLVTIIDKNGCKQSATLTIPLPNYPPIATNDEFFYLCSGLSGDVVNQDNGNGIDSDPEGGPVLVDVTLIEIPKHGKLTMDPDQSGKFTFVADPGFAGDDQFKYVIYDIKNNISTPATVIIHIVSDVDGDGLADDLDADADGDGILNQDEILAGQDWKTADSDGDGNPNWLDIDSDDDGIVDNIEAQYSMAYIAPSGKINSVGLDKEYDPAQGGVKIVPIDSESDSSPDFLDVDADSDGVPDYIEGHDQNSDGKPDQRFSGKDSDSDGLDDIYDTLPNGCNNGNSTGAVASLQDYDGDGIRDWRDEDDDNDDYLTRFEDLNVDGDWSNDTFGHPGHPEYLWRGRNCELFIPDAFSPNSDNIHDYFQIFCIELYPNAKIYIFDQTGNKLYEKEHYGNIEFWGTPERTWWDGKTTNRMVSTNLGKVPQGTYYYVLQLGNGEVRKSFVFVSY